MSQNQNTDSSMFSGDIDPEIAELMGIEPETAKGQKPEFDELFDEGNGDEEAETLSEEVDLPKDSFPPITKFEDKPKPYFNDSNYYKKALSGEGAEAKRLHELLSKFLKAEDPKDKSLYRSKVIPAYWNFLQKIAQKIYRELPLPKILTLRYGALLPTLISSEQRTLLSKIPFENEIGESVHYVDEWLSLVSKGRVSLSAQDETKVVKKNDNQKLLTQVEKAKGQKDVQLGLVKGKIVDIENLEEQLRNRFEVLLKHEMRPGYQGLIDVLSAEQRDALSDINEMLRKLSSMDKELASFYNNLEDATKKYNELEEKADELGEISSTSSADLVSEFNTIRQMAKLCVGKQGNHFPILMKQYFRSTIKELATRENIIHEMDAIEKIDPGIFQRTFKRQTNRIVPHVIIVPCYGEKGICWEPFERFNKATSRGRVAIPMFPKNIKSAILYALGDLRWQVAKEKAQHYWMEEGLTGKYYQWFTDRKMKGDVRDAFIQDYILWITKEYEGTQKLDREVRGIFWRTMPFPQEIKDNLKNRGFVYNELYKKDVNISMSDGY